MSLINRPNKSKYQVGETVFFLNGSKGDSSNIVKVVTSVADPASDNTGVQENLYYLEGFVRVFQEEELYHSINALMFVIKGGYLSDISQAYILGSELSTGVLLTHSNLANGNYGSSNFTSANFEGSNLSNSIIDGCILQNTNLKKCDFRNSSATGSDFTGAHVDNSNFTGANLTGAILPSSANTKSSFKSTVGEGHWDPETTIWTDGLPIGN
jgi:hypothetical protein